MMEMISSKYDLDKVVSIAIKRKTPQKLNLFTSLISDQLESASLLEAGLSFAAFLQCTKWTVPDEAEEKDDGLSPNLQMAKLLRTMVEVQRENQKLTKQLLDLQSEK